MVADDAAARRRRERHEVPLAQRLGGEHDFLDVVAGLVADRRSAPHGAPVSNLDRAGRG